MAKLTKEEKALEASIGRGEWKSSGHETRNKLIAAAQAKREARVNIRLTDDLLEQVRLAANREGIPYQTYIASVLHKAVTRQYVNREEWEDVVNRLVERQEEKAEKKEHDKGEPRHRKRA
jgi:predicted DNA binding CopG/RHH family protein